jgi:iron complex outermembrane recepter protein
MSRTLQSAASSPRRTPAAIAVAVLVCGAPELRAGEPEDPALRLGTVVVTGAAQRDGTSATVAEMREADALTVGPALELMPGVSQSKVGARNEQMVYVRGFDLRQTPVFIDGVPVYVPYDGYVDLGRFNTFDLSRVQLEKGYSSMLYGANTLGGAINLVGRRPTRPLELDGGVGLSSDRDAHGVNALWGYANLGMRESRWYAQLSASHLAQAEFPLPAGFTPTKAEDGDTRNNSRLRDRKLSAKVGWTPNAEDEYALNVIDQHGTKEVPPYAGAVASVTPRYWRWPYWDKQSTYLLTRTTVGAHVLKLRAYHDVFRNSLFTYDDAAYSTQAKPSSFRSWYDDFTNGASAQFDAEMAPANKLGVAAHWKQDVHREHNAGEPIRRFEDITQSFAVEDSHQFSSSLLLVTGIGHDARQTRQAQDYSSGTKVVSEFAHGDGSTNNGQVALQFTPTASWQWHASVARKSRFPTIKDRYSYRLGTALPNADLRPERATHFELGVSGKPTDWLTLDAAIFRSNITDLIQSVTIGTLCGTSACVQAQNIGRVRAQGIELGGEARLGAWSLDGHYQFLDRKNLSQPGILLTDTPRQQAMAHLAWTASQVLSLHANLKVASSRYSSSDGAQVAGKFAVLDLKARWKATSALSFEAGVHNLTDRVYAYTEGFPEPGRELFAQARASWQ